MRSKFRFVFAILFFVAIAAAGSLVWAAHGHGGGGGGGGWGGGHGGGGWGGGSFHGGSVHFSGHNSFHGFDHGGFDHGHFDHGHFDGHHDHFNNFAFGFPFVYPYYYSNYWYPYSYYSYGYPSYYGYPAYYDSYPGDYYAESPVYDGESLPAQAYVASRPVGDVARLEVRVPDPEARLWVQGKAMATSGNVRQFQSPQLDASHKYTYTVRAEWNDNGKVVSDERQIYVRANAFSFIDFTHPAAVAADAQGEELPALPPPQQQPDSN